MNAQPPPAGFIVDVVQGQSVQSQGQPPAGQYPPVGQYPPGQYGPPPQGGQYPPPGMQPQPGYCQPLLAPDGHPPPQQPGIEMEQRPAVQMMQGQASIPGVPPGLEYLSQINQLLVDQVSTRNSRFPGLLPCNKYQIKNTIGQQVYFAAEESDGCMRKCCGAARSFTMHITDNFDREIIRVIRDFKCWGCTCCAFSGCCAMEVKVEAPVGQVVGYIKQQVSCMAAKYAVQDANLDTTLMIEGPVLMCHGPCCSQDIDFKVRSADGVHEVGQISKLYKPRMSGWFEKVFTDRDNFVITFPADLDVSVKATLLGAVFLIDYMFFEQQIDDTKKSNHRGRRGRRH